MRSHRFLSLRNAERTASRMPSRSSSVSGCRWRWVDRRVAGRALERFEGTARSSSAMLGLRLAENDDAFVQHHVVEAEDDLFDVPLELQAGLLCPLNHRRARRVL